MHGRDIIVLLSGFILCTTSVLLSVLTLVENLCTSLDEWDTRTMVSPCGMPKGTPWASDIK